MSDKEEKNKMNEYKKNPMINFSDSINRSIIGDLNNLIKGNFITRIITLIILAAILFLVIK
ncbi:DUF6366 family protein [Konateibacter massiliensis]|uniref:DUF6366 family protein n=1 Tax=Konateibacter massiliensis TaxID=2002841 RepID=UPI000C15C0DB|nr:DUF6366 family protein [Konateibacter massiliensis]